MQQAEGRPLDPPAKAKRVVQFFMAGAASHLDLFDFKPELVKRHGQPSDFGEKVEAFQNGLGPWLGPVWDFSPHGGCGKMLSEPVAALGDRLFPNAERHLKSPAQMARLFHNDAVRACVAIRQRRPDLVVLCFAPDDEEACQVLQMLQLDPTTRRIPILAYIAGEPYAIISGEWPRTKGIPSASSSWERCTVR